MGLDRSMLCDVCTPMLVPVEQGSCDLNVPKSFNLGGTCLHDAVPCFVELELEHAPRLRMRGGVVLVRGVEGLYAARARSATLKPGDCLLLPGERERMWFVQLPDGSSTARCMRCLARFARSNPHFESAVSNKSLCWSCAVFLAKQHPLHAHPSHAAKGRPRAATRRGIALDGRVAVEL